MTLANEIVRLRSCFLGLLFDWWIHPQSENAAKRNNRGDGGGLLGSAFVLLNKLKRQSCEFVKL